MREFERCSFNASVIITASANMKNHSYDYSKEQLLYDPQPGTAAAAARDFGIDLTLTIQNLRLSAEERIRRNDDFVDAIRQIQANGRWLKKPQPSGTSD
jgi:hypothetical protein